MTIETTSYELSETNINGSPRVDGFVLTTCCGTTSKYLSTIQAVLPYDDINNQILVLITPSINIQMQYNMYILYTPY